MAQAQEQVKGKVIEAKTPGVSILIDKSTRGVTTDVDGTFEIFCLHPDDIRRFFILKEATATLDKIPVTELFTKQPVCDANEGQLTLIFLVNTNDSNLLCSNISNI